MRWSAAAAAAGLALATGTAIAVAGPASPPPTRVEVTELPGWDGPLPSRWFTGYLDGGKKDDGKQLWYHYTLIYAEGPESEVFDKPLILWTNGGPGASSNFGLFTELGPFNLMTQSMRTKAYNETGIPTLFRNEYNWAKLGSILVLNGPPPVSFSYCDPPGPAGTGFECGSWDDASTARANHHMVESFYRTHPEFAKNDFYLTGESYAGIYIPTLAREILKADPETSIARRQFRGMAVGDGCVGTDVVCSGVSGKNNRRESLFKAKFLYGHHQFPTGLYEAILEACEPHDGDDDECDELLDKMAKSVGYYFAYNLYDECWDDVNLPTADVADSDATAHAALRAKGRSQAALDLSNEMFSLKSNPMRLGGAIVGYPCGGGGALSKWIQHPEVRKALGVAPNARFVSGDNSAALNYTTSETNLMPLHRHVAEKTDIRVMIYNGDTDPTLNSFIAEWWVNELGLTEIEAWRPWTLDGKKKVVGYVTSYDKDFWFVTIRGGGHMLPGMKPAASFEMLRSFLANSALPGFTP